MRYFYGRKNPFAIKMVWQAIFVLIGVNALRTVLGPTPAAAQSFTYNRLKDMLMGSPPLPLSAYCLLLSAVLVYCGK